jgi:hypothetical protein
MMVTNADVAALWSYVNILKVSASQTETEKATGLFSNALWPLGNTSKIPTRNRSEEIMCWGSEFAHKRIEENSGKTSTNKPRYAETDLLAPPLLNIRNMKSPTSAKKDV